MSTHRHNFYRFIHKGIRRELGELVRAAATLDFTDRTAAQAYTARLRESVTLMGAHAHHEDAHIEPLIERFAPPLARRITATHRVLDHQEHELLRGLEAALHDASASHEFYLALTRYAATQLGHMAEEEGDVIELLWTHLGDDEIRAVEGAIVESCSPAENAVYMDWMIRGMSEPERAEFVDGMRQGAPLEVVAYVEHLVELARGERVAA